MKDNSNDMCQSTDNEKLRRSINRNTDRLDFLAKEVKELKEASAETSSPMPVAVYDPQPAQQPFPNDYATTSDLNKVATVMGRMDTSIRTLTGKIPDAQKPPSLSKEEIREEVKAGTVEAIRGKDVRLTMNINEEGLAKYLANSVVDRLTPKIGAKMASAMESSVSKVVNEKCDELKWTAKNLSQNVRHVLHGAVWAAIPDWIKVVGFIIVACAVGFGYGFYNRYQACEHLKQSEWLYRNYRSILIANEKQRQYIIDTEKEFRYASPHQADSLHKAVRDREEEYNARETYFYYYPYTD